MNDLLLALLLTKGDNRQPGEKSVSGTLAEKDTIKAMFITFIICALLSAVLYIPVYFTEDMFILNLVLSVPFGLSFFACVITFLTGLYGLLLSPFY